MVRAVAAVLENHAGGGQRHHRDGQQQKDGGSLRFGFTG